MCFVSQQVIEVKFSKSLLILVFTDLFCFANISPSLFAGTQKFTSNMQLLTCGLRMGPFLWENGPEGCFHPTPKRGNGVNKENCHECKVFLQI